jgi:hypothetical protein
MATRLTESFAWCNFANSAYKATFGSGFFGGPGATPTLTGSIAAGPFAGTFGKVFQVAAGAADFVGNTGWNQVYDLGAAEDTLFVAMWIKPSGIVSRQTFFSLATANDLSNPMTLHINAAGKLEWDAQPGRIMMNQLVGVIHAASSATIPMNTWTHICIRITTPTTTGGCNFTLWINGALDTFAGPFTLAAQMNLATLDWQAAVGTSVSIEISQLFICDKFGSVNNGQIPPAWRMTTYFPASDVANGGWVPLVAGPNFAMVNNTIGPSSAAYVSLPSLTFPDELFGLSPLLTTDQNIALAVNIASQKAGASTFQALMQQGATKYLLGSPITAPAATLTYQAIADNNPATGAPWKDADISANGWGMRGLTGTGEQVEQYFIEKVWTSGLGSYSY